MSSAWKNNSGRKRNAISSDQRAGVGQYDARSDLGYATLKQKFHGTKQLGSSYPYADPDQYDDLDIDNELTDDDDLDAFVKKVNLKYKPNDFNRAAARDPFSFASGNTRMSESGTSTSSGMVPYPRMYKGRDATLGGGNISPTVSQSTGPHHTLSRPTGSKVGYASPPPLVGDDINDDEFMTLKDMPTQDEMHMKKLRDLIRAIFYEQEVVNNKFSTK